MSQERRKCKAEQLLSFFLNSITHICSPVQNPNIRHYESLIDAELADLAGDSRLAKKHYEVAIVVAGRRGFTNDEALAHERFGEHALHLGDLNDASYHFERAIALYQEWGAHARVLQLRSAHNSLLLPPPILR